MQIKALLKNEQNKYKNSVSDLVEDPQNSGNQQAKKGIDPSKKIKKEDHLKFKKDFKAYKQENKFDDNGRVCAIDESYSFLIEECKKRGMNHNKDIDSIFFDFKYCAGFKHVDLNNLYPGQQVNHIVGSSSFTKKVGLAKYLRQTVWECNVDCDAFFPRCYELTNCTGLFNFVQDFKGLEALNRLKTLMSPSARIVDYVAEKHFNDFLKICVYTTCLKQRTAALVQFGKKVEKFEINSSLLDVLNHQLSPAGHDVFLLSKGAIRESVLGELGFEPTEDFIADFLKRIQGQVTKEMIQKAYSEVLH